MHLMSPSAPIPLFDRFMGRLPEQSGVRLAPDEALRLSLRLDLTRLLNVRNGLSIDQFLDGAPTSLDYGLPDTLGLSAQSASDLQRWQQVVARAIALYEPRLVQVRVVATPDRARPTLARISIQALALLDSELCQFLFDAALGADVPAARGN